jgi:hypothetical protein
MVPSGLDPYSGAMFWQGYYGGDLVPITSVGTFPSGSSPYSDGFEIYLFLQPAMWSIDTLYNYLTLYTSTPGNRWLSSILPTFSYLSSVECDVIRLQSSILCIINGIRFGTQAENKWCYWHVECWVVANPNGNNPSVSPNPLPNLGGSYAGWCWHRHWCFSAEAKRSHEYNHDLQPKYAEYVATAF